MSPSRYGPKSREIVPTFNQYFSLVPSLIIPDWQNDQLVWSMNIIEDGVRSLQYRIDIVSFDEEYVKIIDETKKIEQLEKLIARFKRVENLYKK